MKRTLTSMIRVTMTTIVLSLVGCIEMEHDLHINADASAVYRLNYAITEQAVSQFRAMMKLKNNLAEAAGEPAPGPELEPLLQVFLDPNEADLRNHITRFEDFGVTISSLKQASRMNWRHIELQLDIRDLSMLASIPFFNRHGFNLNQNAEGRYTLDRPPHLDDSIGIPDPFSEHERRQVAPFLDGFKVVVSVTPPGRILSTTAGRTALQTARWEFDFNRQPLAVQTLLRQHFHIVFDAPQAELPVLTMTPENAVAGE